MIKKVGIFDSGKGGKNVADYLEKVFPDIEIELLIDRKNFPYGIKNKGELLVIGKANIETLLKEKSVAIIIACNTMSCVMEDYKCYIPLLRINEMIIKEVNRSSVHKILVLCTEYTKKSNYFQSALNEYSLDIVACQELVVMVEKSIVDVNYINELIVEHYDCDGIILGCTHFICLKQIISELTSKKIIIFDGLSALSQSLLPLLQ